MNTEQLSTQFKNGGVFTLRFWCKMDDAKIDSVIDDVVQVAWCRYLEKPNDDLFKVGKQAAQEYVRKNGSFYALTRGVVETDLAPIATSRGLLPQEISEALFAEFYAQRKPSGPRQGAETRSGGQRRINAAARDTLIVDLLHQGYSDEGIAMEIGATYLSVRGYRKQIKSRLRQMLSVQSSAQEKGISEC